MTPKQVAMIQTSWSEVEPISDVAATLFYERLFDLDPTIRRLFRRTDMVQQRKILMQTLAVVVRSLDRLEQLTPALEGLGRRHARLRRSRESLRQGRRSAPVDAARGSR